MSGSAPPRLLITGGRGRLATLVVDHLRAGGHDVFPYSREPGGGFRALTDLTQPGHLRPTDLILHLAWSTLPATSEKDPGQEQRHDLPLLEGLLGAVVAARAHLVFFSSGGAVYGDAPGRPSREDDPCRPIGCYGRAKLAAESLVTAATERSGLPSTILRISNPYGYPVPSGRVQGVIPHAIRCAMEQQPLTLWGDGHARKDFIHHTDFLAALTAVIRHRPAGIYNLACGESHSVREIIGLVARHTGRTVRTSQIEAPAWDVQDSRLDPRRLINAVGWHPAISLDAGIGRAVADYRASRGAA